jgi:hypothetical protein
MSCFSVRRPNLGFNLTFVMTPEQVQNRKDKAVRFVADVLQDPDRAAEIDSESIEDYAARKKIQINPNGGARMKNRNPRGTGPIAPAMVNPAPDPVDDGVLKELENLRREKKILCRLNEDLQDRLDKVTDLASADGDDGDDDRDILAEKLNDILDVTAPGTVDDNDEDEN